MKLADLGEPLAAGRTAQIFAWQPGWVVKLFNEGFPADEAAREQARARIAQSSGIATPAVGALVRIDGRQGLLFERIDGESGMQQLSSGSVDVAAAARQLAELHTSVHEQSVSLQGMPRQKDLLHERIGGNDALDRALRQRLLARLNDLPDGDCLCHGDFHPGNLIHAAGGPFVVDWVDASRGHPIADVTRSLVLFGGHLADAPMQDDARAGMQCFIDTYKQHFFAISGQDMSMVGRWMPLLAAARMREGVAGSRWLLDQARLA